MAPITRSSQYGRQQSSAQSLPPMNIDDDDEDDKGSSSAEDGEAPQDASPFGSARDMLLPLQETANRVSRQVEEFAKSLDQFKRRRSSSDQETWIEAFGLLKKYARATESRRQQTAATTAKNRLDAEDIREQSDSLQLEFNLWSLMETLLKCKCPEAISAADEAARNGFSGLHRYSTNWDIWNAFLDADTIAQEYECVLDWLQESAAQRSLPLEAVVAEITRKSDRGDGIWSAGLIYTKDAIKKQKRSRAWPTPLDPSQPGLKKTHMREEGGSLVTQLDPDAPTREDAHYMQTDEHHEEAAWEICWEMLRRGLRVHEIRSWWADRKESWRTALITGSNEEGPEAAESPWLRIINSASNPTWLAACQLLADNKLGRTLHENAVYGILAGNHQVSVQACKDIEDIFFSYYNAILIERFEDYLAALGRRSQDAKAVMYQPAGGSFSVLQDFLASAESNEFLRQELQHPLNFIESMIMCQNFDKFFLDQGRAASYMAHINLGSAHLMTKDQHTAPLSECARDAAQDEDSVRILAHLQLLLRELGFLSKAYKLHPYHMDNNIVNYIGFLEREAKFSLLPLYASKLSPERATHVLGTILIKVTDAREQEQTVNLMKRYDLNVPTILYAIFKLSNYRSLQQLNNIHDTELMPRITENSPTGSMKQIRLKSKFMGEEMLPQSDEEKAVRSVQWMKYMDAVNWGLATIAVTSVYKMFLLTGKLSAAKQLMEHVRLSATSLTAVGMNLNLAIIADDESVNGDVDMDASLDSIEHSVQPMSPTRRRKESRIGGATVMVKQESNREELAAQSKVWAQLEQLVEVMVALEGWQELANEVENIRGDPRQMRPFKRTLQEALTHVQNTLIPLFDIDFLMLPTDEEEKVQLNLIRNHYIPEIILGYNSVLYFAGHSLSRAYLTQCMTLAQEVAQNDMLTNAFVESGRMRELVSAFALDSQALLRANEVGSKSSTTKKGKRESIAMDGRADIWQVSWREDHDVDSEPVD